jgi:hypothetical protein
MEQLEERYGPSLQELEQLKVELTAKGNDLSFKREVAQLQAKGEMCGREVTRLIAEGQFEQAREKELEQRELKSRMVNLTRIHDQEVEGVKQRINFLLREKQNIAIEVLKEGFFSLQKEGWARLEEAADFIDSSYQEIEKFVRETGSGTSGVGIYNLKVYPHDPTRSLWLKLRKYVHLQEG